MEVATRVRNGSTLVLLARSEEGLNETKKLVGNINKDVKIVIVAVDLSKPNIEQYRDVIRSSVIGHRDDSLSAVIFHNAGQIGQLDRAVELSDILLWQDYYNLNVFSVTLLNSAFMNELKNYTDSITVVNLTSLFGRQPGKYVGLYGSSRAARDMYFKVFAEEEPGCKVLNWSPGMVKTDMVDEFLSRVDVIEGTQKKDDIVKNVLSPEQSVTKLLSVLEKNQFKSGDIVDYYD